MDNKELGGLPCNVMGRFENVGIGIAEKTSVAFCVQSVKLVKSSEEGAGKLPCYITWWVPGKIRDVSVDFY